MDRARLVLLCIALASSGAAADGTVDDVRQWTSLHVSHSYDERFSFNLLSQVRFSDDVSDYDETVLKPAVHYIVAPGVKLTLGYHFSSTNNSPDEHRVWEQIGLARSFAGFDLGLRGRLEQRFIHRLGGTIVRNRVRVKVAHALWNSRWYAVVSEEVLVNLNGLGAGPVSGFMCWPRSSIAMASVPGSPSSWSGERSKLAPGLVCNTGRHAESSSTGSKLGRAAFCA